MHSCSCLCDTFILHFRTAITLASLFLLALADAIPYEKPCNIVLQINFLSYTKVFFSIKPGVFNLIQPRNAIL